MDSARFALVQTLFHQAAELPAADREAFLHTMCAEDHELCHAVERMLKQDEGGEASLLDRALADAAGDVLRPPLPLTLTKQRFGPYRLTRLLGEGGAGVVYLGTRDDLGSVAAIKILRDAWLSPARRERFAEEQRILAQLNHPSIARLYDADTLADGTPWFAMESVEGAPLTEYCRQRLVSIAERLKLFVHVCDAVEYAHRQMVVHRDLKPSNILVTEDGGVKLLDFGIAKPIAGAGHRDVTQTGLRLMTPAYAAPEQFRGGATGVATDVYALGVILYELLADRTPFDLADRTPAEVERLVTETDPVKPSVAASAAARKTTGLYAWADLDTLCLTAMRKDPERRYGSVEALHRDVLHFQRSEPLEARQDGFGYRLRKFVTRRRWPLGIAAGVLLSTASLIGFYTVRLTMARNEALAQARRSERLQEFMVELFIGGEDVQIPSQDLRVVDILDRGMVQARSLSAEPATQVALLRTLGFVYSSLEKIDQADRAAQAAVDIASQRLGPNARDTIESRIQLVEVLRQQSRYAEAEQLARDMVAATQKFLTPRDAMRIKALTGLGEVLERSGQYGEASQVLDEAVRVATATHPDSPEMRNALYGLARVHFYLGRFDESEALYRRVVPMFERQIGNRHPYVAQVEADLGNIELKRGRYQEAERYHRAALERTESWFGAESTQTARNLTQVAGDLNYQGRGEAAVPLLMRALAIQERHFGPNNARLALPLNILSATLMALNRLDEAEKFSRRSLEVLISTVGPVHLNTGIVTGQVGRVLLERGDYRAADVELRKAIAILTGAVGADHLNTGFVKVLLGRSLLRQGRIAEAEVETLDGYRILTGKTAPTTSNLVWAREDLAAIAAVYDSRHQTEKAAALRAAAAAQEAADHRQTASKE